MQELELRSIASSVRNKIEQVIEELSYVDIELQSFPSGACEVASVILGLYLQSEHGVHVVQSVGKRSLFNDNQENNHVWLTVNGSLIVDITADQFDDFHDSVFVGSESVFHDTFEKYDTRPVDFSYLIRSGSEGYSGVYQNVLTSLKSTQQAH